MGYSDRLTQLRNALGRSRGISAELENMRPYREALESKLTALKDSLLIEDMDVSNLQGINISTVLLTIRGKLGERKEQQEAEALAVRLKLNETESELAEITGRMDSLAEEQSGLASGIAEYEQLFEQKKQWLSREGSESSQKIAALLNDINRIASQNEDIGKALKCGESIVSLLGAAINGLIKAEEFKELEFGSRGMSDVKYEYMDEASENLEKAKEAFQVFKADAPNIEIMRDNSTHTGFLVADIMFEDIIPNWYSGGKIERAKTRIAVIKSEIYCDVLKLKQLSEENKKSLNSLAAQLDELVLGAAD